MIIGIYSDAHFSTNSSILIGKSDDSIYSKRLDSLVKSYKWMYEVFKSNRVEVVINCGDTTSSDTINSEENAALSEALSYSSFKEYHILGNHEVTDSNKNFSSVDILGGYSNITLVKNYLVTELDDTPVIMIPYTSSKESIEDIQYKLLDIIIPSILFTHLSYIGDGLLNGNGFLDSNGLDKDLLLSNGSITRIFNGHLHNALDLYRYHQIGSLIGNGFGDSYTRSLPRIMIYDTSSDILRSYINPYSVLFYKIKSDTLSDLIDTLSNISNNKKCLQVTVPINIRDQVSNYINDNLSKYNIIDYRVRTELINNDSNDIVTYNEEILSKIEKISDNNDISNLLRLFNKECSDDLPFSFNIMEDFIDRYVGGK